ncbi:MAG: NTP transferase domain-containing protein, partial [Muribaculaceae bacterium]|nr:NTP transferase domain-containing protein [Muribaculaceae bacterium]
MNLIPHNATLLQALERLNALPGSAMTLFVTDNEGRVTGSLTDGDIRRALVAGRGLDATVDCAARRGFKALRGDDSDVELMRECRRLGIKLVPRLNPDGTLAEIVDLSVTRSRLPVSAVLMAGGRGERLRPMTLTVPKPLLKIEEKAIIDYNIEALAAVGIKDITVTTGYLADQIADHFSVPVAGVKVKTVCESMPLGTVGAARLADLPELGDTLVMNSDLITTISFEELYLKHRDTGAEATVAVIPYQVSVPYAILTIDGDRVSGIEEKPSYS